MTMWQKINSVSKPCFVVCIGSFLCVFSVSVKAHTLKQLLENNKGNKAANEKSYDEAKIYYFDALKDGGENGEVYFNLGNVAQEEGDYEAAETYYNQSISQLPDSEKATAMYNLGNTYLAKGDLSAAKDAYIATLQRDANFHEARHNLEVLLKQQKEKKEQEKQQNKEKEEQQNNQSKDPSNQQDKGQEKEKQGQGDKDDNKNQPPPSDASEKQKKRQITNKQQADAILNALLQKEKQARQQYLKEQQVQQKEVEKDW